MNVALREHVQAEYHTDAEQRHTVSVQWLKVLLTVIVAACLMTVVAVASVWLKLEIDKKYQRIDAVKIKTAELKKEIPKLEAKLMQLKSFDIIEKKLSAAGVIMEAPKAIFYVDPTNSTGKMALSINAISNDHI